MGKTRFTARHHGCHTLENGRGFRLSVGDRASAHVQIIPPDIGTDNRSIRIAMGKLFPGVIRLYDNPVLVQHADMRGERVQDRAGKGMAGLQCLLRNLSLGDVFGDAQQVLRFASIVINGDLLGMEGTQALMFRLDRFLWNVQQTAGLQDLSIC